MPVYSALLFDGKRQHVITQPCESEETFINALNQQFGVYVCLWLKEMPADSQHSATLLSPLKKASPDT